jgi:hypothetical protein
MADPAQIDITADRRVDHSEELTFLGVDWTGSTFKMQVRQVRDTTGTPLLDLSSGGGSFSIFYAATDTIANHIAADRLLEVPEGYVSTDSLALTVVHFGISGGSLTAMPEPPQIGDDLTCFYDIIRTPGSGSAEVIAAGKFIVRAGVTIP